MKTNPLRTLESCGQSVWLDYIHRDLIEHGGLQRLIDEDELRGMFCQGLLKYDSPQRRREHGGKARTT